MNYRKFRTHKWICWISLFLLMANPAVSAETGGQQYDASPTGSYIAVQPVRPGENPIPRDLFYDPRIQLKTPLSLADPSDKQPPVEVTLSADEKLQVASLYREMAVNITTASDGQKNIIRQAEAIYQKAIAKTHGLKMKEEEKNDNLGRAMGQTEDFLKPAIPNDSGTPKRLESLAPQLPVSNPTIFGTDGYKPTDTNISGKPLDSDKKILDDMLKARKEEKEKLTIKPSDLVKSEKRGSDGPVTVEKKYENSPSSLPEDIPRLNPRVKERDAAPPIIRFFYDLSDRSPVAREVKQSKDIADLFQIDTPTIKDFPNLLGRYIKKWLTDVNQRVDDKSIKDLLAENKDFFELSDEAMMQSLFNDSSQKLDGQKGVVVDSVNWSLPIVATYVLTNPPKHMIPWLRIMCWWRLVNPKMMRDYVKASAKLAEFRRKVAQGKGFKIRYIPYDEFSRQTSKNFGSFFRKLMPDEIGCVQLVMSGQKKD